MFAPEPLLSNLNYPDYIMSEFAFDVIDSLLNSLDFFRVLIGYFDFELILKSYDKINHVQRICTQIVDKGCAFCDLTFADF